MAKILVVDDEAIITMQLEERLSSMGYTVAGMAASGADAVEKARRLQPDLVLMDIVMPGKLNGIEAAQVIISEMNIPIVFVTSYADDAIIQKAKQVRPYGYIIKPFNELEIKAAIEVALFRRAADQELAKRAAGARGSAAGTPEEVPEADAAEYIALPEIRTVLLKDIFSDIILFLYTDPTVKTPIFKFAIEEGQKKGWRSFFAYYRSVLQKSFIREIQSGELVTRRIKPDELYTLGSSLEKFMESPQGEAGAGNLQVLIDFSETDQFEEVLVVKNQILLKKGTGTPISGMIAVSMANLDHSQIKQLSDGIPKIIVSTGKDTTLSFSHTTFYGDALSVVPQATLDDIVKKSLEPVVLSLLEKPISGYDIVHEIHNRYKVLIPQARIYTYLYGLQDQGFLEVKVSGKSKLYHPTESGKKYIRQRMNEFRFVFRHILGEGAGPSVPPAEKK